MTRDEYRDRLIHRGITSLPTNMPLQEKACYLDVANDVAKNPTLKKEISAAAKACREADKAQMKLYSIFKS